MSLSSTSHQPMFETDPADPAVPAWRVELNAKLAAHRQRRPSSGPRESEAGARTGARQSISPQSSDVSARAALVAARVAERYAHAPSYSEFLAASAAAAAAAAETAAFAARQAQDAADTFARLSAGAGQPAYPDHHPGPQIVQPCEFEMGKSAPGENGRNTVEHPEPLPVRGVVPPRPAASSAGLFANGIVDPIAEATVPAAVSLPAKLIEFPRELVAPRKSRPRLAEGPLVESSLFDDADAVSLRIFEVEGDRMGVEPGRDLRETSAAFLPRTDDAAQPHSLEPAPHHRPVFSQEGHAARESYSGSTPDTRPYNEPVHGAPGWQSIRLGEHPSSPTADQAGKSLPDTEDQRSGLSEAHVLYTASLGDRTMAALVDAAVVTGAFMLFVLIFALCTAHPPLDRTALGCAALLFAGLFVFYEWLFMSYGGGTLGMRYARIALCTFDDENPTRQVLRRRVVASVLSALPLGLGFLWAIFDEDSLGWHDRMTRSYQRSYR